MFDKLEEVEKRYEDLSSKLISSEVISDGKLYSKYAKEQNLHICNIFGTDGSLKTQVIFE